VRNENIFRFNSSRCNFNEKIVNVKHHERKKSEQIVHEYIREGITFLSFDLLEKETEVLHAVTTRQGGKSLPPFDSLNLGLHVGDDPERVIGNYELLSTVLAFGLDTLVACKQVHGDRVIEVREGDERRLSFLQCREEGDAMVTNIPGLVLMVRVADCIPVVFYDPVQRVIGIAHAGWRGTCRAIAAKTVEVLIDRYASNPATILVGIGPGIGPCCYEVDNQVKSLYEEDFSYGRRLIEERNGKLFLNLWEANRSQMLDTGIREEHIELAGLCTSCHPQFFFSHRRERGRTGRFAALIGMKG